MRWYWIDRFTEFESGQRAVSVKNVSLAEDHMADHFFGFPLMPHSLVIEGIAQTGGLLVGEHNGFRERVVLAKLGRAKFYDYARPGDTLTYTTTIQDVNETGALISATSYIGDRHHADVDMFFAHLDDRTGPSELFTPIDFLSLLRSFRLFEVGKQSDGSPLEVPAHLLAAEKIASEADVS
jgi:3-hydroxyacyl-[acyl-carrier-protein] dehydratase